MEKYNKFMGRICSFEKPELSIERREFIPNKSLYDKVDYNNSFNSFYGDTVVFNLDSKTKKVIFGIIERLYKEVPQCFSEKLIERSLHMTLHDLSNSKSFEEVQRDLIRNEMKIKEIQELFLGQTIMMKTNYITNMCSISLVMGLYPADEDEYIKLMQLYSLVDKVIDFHSDYTPHITLAYYNQNGFGEKDASKLVELVSELNKSNFYFVLDTHNLIYQRFTSMNNYENVLRLVK